MILSLIAGLRVVGNDPDSLMYAKIISEYSGFLDVNLLSKEPGFWVLVIINNIFFNQNITSFFILYAIFAVALKLYMLNKISPFPILSIVLYIGFYFVLHEMNQIRIGLASGFLLMSLEDINKRNKFWFFVKTLFAVFFHYSTLFWFLAYSLGRHNKISKKYLFFPIFSFVFFLIFNEKREILSFLINFLPQFISFKLSLYLDLATSGLLDDTKKIYLGFGSIFLYLMLVVVYLKKRRVLSSPRSDLFTLLYKITSMQLVFGAAFLIINVELSNRIYTYLGVVSFLLLPPFVATLFRQKTAIFIIFGIYAIKQLTTSVNYILG